MPTRVVRVITRLNIGGPAIQAMSLSNRLAKRGVNTLLIHGKLGPREGDMTYLLPSDTPTVYLPALKRPIRPMSDAQAMWQIYRLLCRSRPHIVHTHLAKAGFLGRLATLMFNRTLGRDSPAKIVHTYHGHVFDGYFDHGPATTFVRLERWLARYSDTLVAISPRIRNMLVKTYAIGRLDQYRVVPLGFDLSPFHLPEPARRAEARRALALPPDALVVTTVGRLTAIKRHSLFLDTARAVLGQRPHVVFLLAGDGELRHELEQEASQGVLRGQTQLLGWTRDLETLYAASDVFLLTSRNEGTPVALIEAMAAGLACVSPDVGGVRDVITDDGVGIVVESSDPRKLAGAVLGLLEAPERREMMGKLARASVLKRFDVERLVSNIETLYHDLTR